ncbi:hypothetical protein GCM10027321_45460 [Massilia terrae]|uniref:Lipoprotein n=1 Tax=Massilia terrae TaxID=1811224 RepID=A0ABT2CYF4_9BURK|nr:hypothetical protein [Massilia terrae]MCS0659011.1 hypothetical protein [Massilia terrae]
MTISQKLLHKANKRRVIANAILIAPIFALLSACGGGDVPYGDALNVQAAELDAQVRPANYQVDSVEAPSSDTNPPVITDTATAAADTVGAASTIATATPATPASPAAPGGASNTGTPPADPASQMAADARVAAASGTTPGDAGANVNPANAPSAGAVAAAAAGSSPAQQDGSNNAAATLTASAEPVKTPDPTTIGSDPKVPAVNH